jgi:hypothetical protein
VDALETVIDERINVAIRDCEDAATAAAVPAVGAAARYIFLTPKRCRAVAAFAGVNLNGNFVDEFHS